MSPYREQAPDTSTPEPSPKPQVWRPRQAQRIVDEIVNRALARAAKEAEARGIAITKDTVFSATRSIIRAEVAIRIESGSVVFTATCSEEFLAGEAAE